MSKYDDKLVSTGWHYTYGWLRRPEMDGGNGYCYEEPDGNLVYSAHRQHKTMCRLEQYRRNFTGEKYEIFADIRVNK